MYSRYTFTHVKRQIINYSNINLYNNHNAWQTVGTVILVRRQLGLGITATRAYSSLVLFPLLLYLPLHWWVRFLHHFKTLHSMRTFKVVWLPLQGGFKQYFKINFKSVFSVFFINSVMFFELVSKCILNSLQSRLSYWWRDAASYSTYFWSSWTFTWQSWGELWRNCPAANITWRCPQTWSNDYGRLVHLLSFGNTTRNVSSYGVTTWIQ